MDAQSRLDEISKRILHNMRRADFIKILTLPIWIKDVRLLNHLTMYDNKLCTKPYVRFHRIEKAYMN